MKQYEKEEYQAYLDSEKATIAAIKKAYEDALEQVDEKIRVLSTRTDVENMPTIIHQQKYQLQLKEQLEGILDKLQENQYKTVNDYLNECYSESFLRTMYSLNQQGIPFVWPIDQKAVERAVVLDSKISGGLYAKLGVDVKNFKKSISSEISRGIASSLSYSEIARNLKNASRVPISNASRIVRTEGHRIQNRAKMDTMQEAKKKGADVVKQWDATLDGTTRPTHRELDGQIREIDEDFEVGGMRADVPGNFGDPAEDCNCRCTCLTRARWALDDGFTKMDNFTKELRTFELPADYDQFKKDYWSDENVKYIKYVADKEEKYGTKNFEKLLDSMSDREYAKYRSLMSENPLLTIFTPKAEIKTATNPNNAIISPITDKLLKTNIKHIKTEVLSQPLNTDEIIAKVGGGDMTDGSCTSLSFAYTGNKYGYDVLDFRGGDSCDFFAKTGNIVGIANLPGVNSAIVEDYNDIKGTISLLKTVEKNKEYILSTGEHTAIIRKSAKGIDYLELQSASDNGFHNLTTKVLENRFGCKKSHSSFGQKMKAKSILIDIESLGNNDEFKHILGYINTSNSNQKKGTQGHVK